MKKKSPYMLLVLCMLISSFIFTFISYYSTGVVERSEARSVIDERLDKMAEKIDEGYNEEKLIKNQICENYEYRAKMIALMISQSNTSISDENALEEMRIAINADEISITNSKGIIEYSTSFREEDSAEQVFIDNISDRNFTKAIIQDSDDGEIIIIGTARVDKTGIIQITFTTESIEQLVNYFDISNVTSEYPLLNRGCMAIIDINSYKYLSHTDSALTGTAVQIPAEKFNGEKYNFYSYYNGSRVFIRYRIYNDKIILGMIPTSEIYSARDAVTAWVAIVSIMLSIISFLALRKHIIDENEKGENKNDSRYQDKKPY